MSRLTIGHEVPGPVGHLAVGGVSCLSLWGRPPLAQGPRHVFPGLLGQCQYLSDRTIPPCAWILLLVEQCGPLLAGDHDLPAFGPAQPERCAFPSKGWRFPLSKLCSLLCGL